MIGIAVVIVVISLLLIAFAFIDKKPWERRHSVSPDVATLETVRDAAFAVIEASLEAEPEKWEAIPLFENSREIQFVVRRDIAVAIHVGDAEPIIYTHCKFKDDGSPRVWSDADAATKSYRSTKGVGKRIKKAALAVGRPNLDQKEINRLNDMVAIFGQVIDRRKHDQAAS